MKRVSGLLLFCFVVISSFNSQNLLFGVELGTNIIPIEKTAFGTNFQFGTFAGGRVKYELIENLSFSTGLYFSQRKKMYAKSDTSTLMEEVGLDSSFSIPGTDMNVYRNTKGLAIENYVELPVSVNYSYKNFFVSAGPYVAFLLSGKKKEETRTTTPFLQTFDVSTIDSSGFISMFLPPADATTSSEESSIDNLARFDFGASFGIGYAMDNVSFRINYTQGLNDYRIVKENDEKENHSSLRISVCYFFNKKLIEKPSLQ